MSVTTTALRKLTSAQRLIVAADFSPGNGENNPAWVRANVRELAKKLRGTGVTLKVNSGLRAVGQSLLDEVHDQGLGVFADLKLVDIKETLSLDGAFLRASQPELLTVYGAISKNALVALKAALPNTEILAVTVPTDFTLEDCMNVFGERDIALIVSRLANHAREAGVDGLISSAKEVEMLKRTHGEAFTYNTPAVRPLWSLVAGDDQNPDRVMTPAKAIGVGATRIIVGRPVTRNENPADATRRIIDEIAGAAI